MPIYQIRAVKSGVLLGQYEAGDAQGARDAMARCAGFDNEEHANKTTGAHPSRVYVSEVVSCEQARQDDECYYYHAHPLSYPLSLIFIRDSPATIMNRGRSYRRSASLMVDGAMVKCLVVDDNHDGADVVGELLRIFGAEVLVVYSGQEAVDLAPHFQPQMVVLDIKMPVMDGFETCRILGQQQWSSEAMFIAYTGMSTAREGAIAAGFDRVVSKGDPPDVFERILNELAH